MVPVTPRKLKHRLLSSATRKLGRLARDELEGEARLHFETPVIRCLEEPLAIRSACNLIRQTEQGRCDVAVNRSWIVVIQQILRRHRKDQIVAVHGFWITDD